MRFGLIALCGGFAALVSSAAYAACPGDPGCPRATEPVVVYPPAPVIFSVPLTGYVLDPSDARPDLYIVNQGPVYDGPNITWFAAPTYSEGGYAFARPYPYIHSHFWKPYAQRPEGLRYRPYVNRPFGFPPFAAYRYVPPPSARIIEIAP